MQKLVQLGGRVTKRASPKQLIPYNIKITTRPVLETIKKVVLHKKGTIGHIISMKKYKSLVFIKSIKTIFTFILLVGLCNPFLFN